MNKQTIITIIVILALVIGLVVFAAIDANKPGQYDEFAQCLTDQEVTYFGAWWCPNCQNQEKMFGRSASLLPRIECSTPDGQNQTQECQEQGIEAYPTWEFTDGTRLTGVQSFETLAENSGCPLPQNTSSSEVMSGETQL